MPLPLTVSCFSKIQIGFTFLVLAHPGSPGQRAVKRVCVCVCPTVFTCMCVSVSGCVGSGCCQSLVCGTENSVTSLASSQKTCATTRRGTNDTLSSSTQPASATTSSHKKSSQHSTLSAVISCRDIKKGKGSPYPIAKCRVPEPIPVLGSQPEGDVSHKPGSRLPLLSARTAVTLATLKRAATKFRCLVNGGTMGVNSLPKTVTRQHRSCNLNPGPSAPESSTLITRLPSHPSCSD